MGIYVKKDGVLIPVASTKGLKGDKGTTAWSDLTGKPSLVSQADFDSVTTQHAIRMNGIDSTLLSKATINHGNGSPHGVRWDAPGSLYQDDEQTNGAILWINTGTGYGNTGWRTIYGDTGWRNIDTLLSANARYDWSTGDAHENYSGAFRVRRVNNMVMWRMGGYTSTGIGSWCGHIDNWPPGFAPDGPATGFLTSGARQVTVQITGQSWAGKISTLGEGIGGYHNDCALVLDHTTNQPWPTSLPGTPA